jgi:hypothetical protein
MALAHRWARRIGGQPFGYHVPITGEIPLGGLLPPVSSDDTITRTVFHPTVQWSVGTVSAPPESTWIEAFVEVTAWWTDTSDSSFYGVDSDFPDLLIVGHLTPTFVDSPTEAGGYDVIWSGPPDGFQSKGQRRAPHDGVTNPVVNFGITIHDPASGFQTGFYSGQKVTAWGLEETLWSIHL